MNCCNSAHYNGSIQAFYANESIIECASLLLLLLPWLPNESAHVQYIEQYCFSLLFSSLIMQNSICCYFLVLDRNTFNCGISMEAVSFVLV